MCYFDIGGGDKNRRFSIINMNLHSDHELQSLDSSIHKTEFNSVL